MNNSKRIMHSTDCIHNLEYRVHSDFIIDLQDSDWLDGSNLATNFIMRYRWRVSAMADASANENRSYMGFFSSSAWGGDAQDVFAIQFWANTSGIQTFRLECIDNDTFQSGNETRTITSFTPVVDTDYYIEMKKELVSFSNNIRTFSINVI